MSDLPDTMTAIAIRAPAGEGKRGPEVLVPEPRPVPVPGQGEVLVRIAAAGVNRPDVLQRQGGYPPPPGASDIPGLEFSGDIVALGEGAAQYAIADKVCALVAGGGYAEYAVVHETNALPVPDGLSMVEAAALPETFFTVWTNVFQRGRLSAGETFLVHGGTSGIGTTAIMLAKAFGATVLTTVGSPDKCVAARRIGADLAIDYKKEDFVDAVKEATGGRGVDLILDMVGGGYIERNYRAAAIEGRIVQIAFLQGPKVASFDVTPLMLKRLTHTGSTLRARTVAQKALIAGELTEKVWPLVTEGRIKPIIDSTFPLRDAAKAHARMESSEHIGKIMLTV